ncbi:MAG: DNA (cytosine-5-)-methyltransferase, partial [Tannerellaceae bacterium]
MKKTVCELFAGVGGFRCGLNNITSLEDLNKEEKWDTVWFSQWEPAEKNTQYAHNVYEYRFGSRLDLKGQKTTNHSIEDVNKEFIPDFNLLVGGFPCQDYSVASSLATSKGLEGKKGVLWWSIREVLEIKKPPFVLLENVDRLLKSPSKQRGRDFGVILACFRDQGYNVEWRVINAAEYGYQQRRRRVFIFAYKNTTKYSRKLGKVSDDKIQKMLEADSFFAKAFPVESLSEQVLRKEQMPLSIGEVSDNFEFNFENSGIMHDGTIYTVKTIPNYNEKTTTLGEILDSGKVDSSYFIPEERLYYTSRDVTSSNETEERLPLTDRKTWQYLKGGKKLLRTTKETGYQYVFSEGPIAMIDAHDKPARTLLTSEGGFNRSTHIVVDKLTGKIRMITPEEAERIQGFPTGHTKNYQKDNEILEVPASKRKFMMGNAL